MAISSEGDGERKFTPMDIDARPKVEARSRRESVRDEGAIGTAQEEECQDCKELD